MKQILMSMLVFAFAVNGYSASCVVQSTDATGKKIITYGQFTIEKFQSGIESGQMQSKTFDMANEQYAKQTAYLEVSVTKGPKEPFEISYWLITKDRKAEAVTVVKTKTLPFETRIHLQINENSNAIASESAGYVDIICK